MNFLLILGSNSDIAKACARSFAQNGYDILLASRSPELQSEFAKDLELRYKISARPVAFDAEALDSHEQFLDSLPELPKGVLSAVGYLCDQHEASQSSTTLLKATLANYAGIANVFNALATHYKETREGFFIGISSVAGDRGRKSNYIYGSAKAAFTTYLSGLRNELHPLGINVLTVLPGFVETKMTEGLDLPSSLTSTPQNLASKIWSAHSKGRSVIYSSKKWFLIMQVIKHIPEFIFKRMSL